MFRNALSVLFLALALPVAAAPSPAPPPAQVIKIGRAHV